MMTPQPFRAPTCMSRHMTARARVTDARTSLFLRNACLPCSTYCSSTPACSRQAVRLTTWRDMQAGTFPFLSMGSFCVRGNCPAGDARRKADRERRSGQGHCLTPPLPPRACRAIAARSRAIAPSEAATGRRGDTSLHVSPPDGRSTRYDRQDFVALACRAQRTVQVRLRAPSGSRLFPPPGLRLVLTALSPTSPRLVVRHAA